MAGKEELEALFCVMGDKWADESAMTQSVRMRARDLKDNTRSGDLVAFIRFGRFAIACAREIEDKCLSFPQLCQKGQVDCPA